MNLEPLLLSVQVGLVATALATTTGIALAALLRKRWPGRSLFETLLTLPMVLPPTVLGYYLLGALGRQSVIGTFYHALFGAQIVFTKTGAVVAAFVGSLPIVVKSSRAALDSLDPTYAKAARTLGAGPLRTFFTVELALARRTIFASVMLAFARALGDFGATLMVAGNIPGETQTAAIAIYDAVLAHRDSDAIGLVLVLTSMAALALIGTNRLTEGRNER